MNVCRSGFPALYPFHSSLLYPLTESMLQHGGISNRFVSQPCSRQPFEVTVIDCLTSECWQMLREPPHYQSGRRAGFRGLGLEKCNPARLSRTILLVGNLRICVRWWPCCIISCIGKLKMAIPENSRADAQSLFRACLIVFAVFVLTLNVATRYNRLASQAHSLKTVQAVKSPSPDSHRQRLLNDGINWLSPVSRAFPLESPQFSARAISAVMLPIHLVWESWLYSRPPPSC